MVKFNEGKKKPTWLGLGKHLWHLAKLWPENYLVRIWKWLVTVSNGMQTQVPWEKSHVPPSSQPRTTPLFELSLRKLHRPTSSVQVVLNWCRQQYIRTILPESLPFALGCDTKGWNIRMYLRSPNQLTLKLSQVLKLKSGYYCTDTTQVWMYSMKPYGCESWWCWKKSMAS